MSDGRHFGNSDEVRRYGKELSQSLRTLMTNTQHAKQLLASVESSDKGGSYQEGRRIVEDVLSTIYKGFPDIEDTYKKLMAYASYLDSIGQ
jgi:hypothetical protein